MSTPEASARSAPVYASPGSFTFAALAAAFCTLLLVSTIGATKGIRLGPVFTDGGVFVFPLTYVIGDILSEVFGWKAARRTILLGFALMVISIVTFWLVTISPAAPGYTGQESFATVFGVVPRIVLASSAAYLVGELSNAFIVSRLKARNRERRMWQRLASSTLVGQFLDTTVFCLIAGPAIGITAVGDLINYTAAGFALKVTVELVLLPVVTTPVIRVIKQREPSYRQVP